MKLTKLLSMLMYEVDIIEFYNSDMMLLYSFKTSEVPEQCEDRISKFNIYEKEGIRTLEVIEK